MTLAFEAVGYRYAGSRESALQDITLELAPGAVLGIAGASEAGKSTLCLVAAGLAPGTIGGELAGLVTLDGRPMREMRSSEIAARCGIVFQDPANQLSRTAPTVWEEVAFGPRNLSLPLDQVIARTTEALGAMRIEDLADRDPAKLSGGQAQLVAIAAIVAMRPAHLILDEPTAQLDPQGTDLVAAALGRLGASGTSILIAEQKVDLLDRICSRVAVLDRGRIVRQGEPDQVLGDPLLPQLGVAEPALVRLRRLVGEAGLDQRIMDVVA